MTRFDIRLEEPRVARVERDVRALQFRGVSVARVLAACALVAWTPSIAQILVNASGNSSGNGSSIVLSNFQTDTPVLIERPFAISWLMSNPVGDGQMA